MRHTFPKTRRLTKPAEFQRVYADRIRTSAGPFLLHSSPSPTPNARLGLSVPARVGNAVIRNRIKRLLRESFRLLQHELPPGYDYLITVRPHAPLRLADYQELIRTACARADEIWKSRKRH
ncbi:MAG TPA: ribonuclease P protein component [Phycisphaerales bacterium]|nr:ribonuclease P protein component [Phycisphaerales bacterium]